MNTGHEMLKHLLKILAIVIGIPFSVVFLDSVLGHKLPLGGRLALKVNHLIMGGPQSKAIDFDDALTLFDETCMAATVFKLPPYLVDESFLSAGLTEDNQGEFVPSSGPLAAYAFERPEGEGFECFISFVSFEDVERIMKPGFDEFATTRLSKPMSNDPDAFIFEYPPLPEGVQSGRPVAPDPAIIRSFADADGIHYFIILRPDSYSLTHILQLVILPEAELIEAG